MPRSSRAAIAIKVENSSAARPQSGLEDAEIVFEEIVEGGVTRFLALFSNLAMLCGLFGTIVGLIAGYVGGRTDAALMRLMDVLLAFPSQLMLIALVPVVDSMPRAARSCVRAT